MELHLSQNCGGGGGEAEISSVNENVLSKFQNLKVRTFTNDKRLDHSTMHYYNSSPSFPFILSLIAPLTIKL